MKVNQNRIHFIAIGGSVMHNLAIALKQSGLEVSGSDDEIYEPSRSVLARHGLLPQKDGWFPEKLSTGIDAVILGMHAKIDNPELVKAQELGLKIFSFPEYIYEQSKEKQRIVIAGSHGKTTITAIIIHVLNYFKRDFDYVVGAKISGIENTVKLSDAPVIIIEGDEYLSSALDPTPKFLRYQHHVGLISGIAWDHYNVFPTEDDYVAQFDIFADNTPKAGILIFCEQDAMTSVIGAKSRKDVFDVPYKAHTHENDNGRVFLTDEKKRIPIKIFGNHNLQNISGAKELLKKIGISSDQFFEAIQTFEGAAGRLEKVNENADTTIYKDFAHAPSKVKATVKAVRELNHNRDVVACFELHTFSSLNKNFLPQYKDSMKAAQTAVVYFNPKKVKDKNFEPLSESFIQNSFGTANLRIFEDAQKLEEYLLNQSWKNKNLLMMSSGNFGGMDLRQLSEKILRS
jgi:UDP-N-acetylmuramate: L-alanyl-gamma-D-glutamyl-meso-diaminopimelate ligase